MLSECSLCALCVLLLSVCTATARAQTAPAGNAHPRPAGIEDEEPQSNPFGAPGPTKFDSIEAKEKFAKALDLKPLRDLAVNHNDRIKILDTLARESIPQILGRKDYVDFKVDTANPTYAKNVHYDPLFTFLDLIIDPGYYVDKPLIYVEFLPLREAFLFGMYPDPVGPILESEAGQALTAAIVAVPTAPNNWKGDWEALAKRLASAKPESTEWTTARDQLQVLMRTIAQRAETLKSQSKQSTELFDHLLAATATIEDLTTRDLQREWWKRIGRLKPGLVLQVQRTENGQPVTLFSEIIEKYGPKPEYARPIDKVRSELLMFQHSWKNLRMVASESTDRKWSHLEKLPADSAAGKAVRDMGESWRIGDAAKVNAAIISLAAELPKINAAQYPTTRRTLEAAYNRANAFEWGYWLYALALLTLLLAFGTARKWLVYAGVAALFAALAMHSFGFVSRCIIAERFAIQNQFESMTGLSLFAGIVGTVIMLLRRQWLFGAAAAGVGFMVLITATQTGIPGVQVEREAPILNTSVLLKYHVTTVLVSYGLIALGFMVSLFYLGTYYAAKLKGTIAAPKLALVGADADDDAVGGLSASALNIEGSGGGGSTGPARVLHDLDKSQMIILQLAFWALGVGILLGAWWADHSWGRWWAFDPKELWALVTWLVYLVVIHIRFAQIKNRALVTAWLSVLGFIVMLWTYFGVNLILPGLHAYA